MKRATAAERRHLTLVAALPCIVCGARPVEIHHVRRFGSRRDHMRVLPICPRHHRTGGHGVAFHAGRRTWEAEYGSQADMLVRVAAMLERAA